MQITTGDTNGTMTEVLSGNLQPGAQIIIGQLATGTDTTKTAARRSGGASKGAGGGQ